jgi:hypothetical protein
MLVHMSPEQDQLLKDLQVAVDRKRDPVERKELLDKLARVRKDFETEAWRDPNPAETDALLRKAKRVVLFGRIAIGAIVVAVIGTVAWFWGIALRLF